MNIVGLPVMTEVLGILGRPEDIISVRTTCSALRHLIDTDAGVRWFWRMMLRRVAHRPKYAFDLDGCYTLRRIGIRRAIRATRNYMPIYTIQESRKLFGECVNDRHLYKNVMEQANKAGQDLYKLWRKFARARMQHGK